ncbi:MAG: TonB family protein [Bacteroidota bacterium]
MNNFFQYLLELNIAMVVLYLGYRLFFEKDKNFTVRRIYLIATMVLPVLLLFLPESASNMAGRMAPVSFRLEQITVLGKASGQESVVNVSPLKLVLFVYLFIATLGLIKFLVDLTKILLTVKNSSRLEINGLTLYIHPELHASSFFGYIFIDPARVHEDSFHHILEHEQVHRHEWHSVDRILAELIVLVNWFNPVVWMIRRSVIQNLEYLTDSIVVNKGTNKHKYQLSILNQYIGSVSITNQFNSQIKNRIKMLNRSDRMGSAWKLAMIFPMVFVTLFFFSCTDRENMIPAGDENQEQSEPESDIFYIVEEMPLFQNEDPAQSFRKYIVQNLEYPENAAENGISGRVIVQFTVNRTGQVVDAVVVNSVDPALEKEAIRVVMSSPKWTPGRQRGQAVNVLYTFPVNFALQ